MKIKYIGLFCCFLLIFILHGCASGLGLGSSNVKITFSSEDNINDGVLLPVDIIACDDVLSSSVLGVGPDSWFGDPLRDRLTGDNIHRLAISGGSSRSVKVNVTKSTKKIIVYADYELSTERMDQQIVISSENLGMFTSYKIQLNEMRMELLP